MKPITNKNIVLMVGLLIIIFMFPARSVVNAKSSGRYFESLQKRLIDDGFDQKMISDLYDKSEVYFESKGVFRFLVHREAKLNYNQFTSKKSIRNALKYMEAHKIELELTEEEYNVEKEIITAVILVETRLGTWLGGPSILNTLSTVAALADPDVRDIFWARVSNSKGLTRKQYEKWAKRKSTWSYNELKAFLQYTTEENMDPTAVSGSYSGALGIAQFMPSNILAYGKDGDNDGRVDLFNHADAIMSIANYLKYYGWYRGIPRKGASKVIYQYNHSRPYVNTVLKIAKLLKPKT